EVINASTAFIHVLAFSSDGKKLANGGWQYWIPIWDVATGSQVQVLKNNKSRVHGMSFSPDPRFLACTNPDEKCLSVWDLTTGAKKLEVPAEGALFGLGQSPDGARIAFGHSSKCWVVDVATGKVTHSLPGGDPAYSPDGKWLAVQDEQGVILYDAKTLQPLAKIAAGYVIHRHLTFSRGGRLLAFLESQKVVAVWDLQNRVILHRLEGHFGQVGDLTFCPDGKTLAT